jgi:hypothetical protein
MPAIRHLAGFRSRSDVEAGTFSLRLFEQPVAQIAVVIDVEAQEDPDVDRLPGCAQIEPCEWKSAVYIDSV